MPKLKVRYRPRLEQLGEMHTKHNVTENLVVVHVDMANGDTQTQDLLELELDGGANLGELVGKVLRVGHGGGELAGLGKTGTKETRNLLDKCLRGKESVVLLGKLFDEFLVLVEPGDVKSSSRIWIRQGKRTSSGHQQTCIQGRSAWHDRCRLHQRECRWTCGDEEHWGAC